MCIRDRSGTDPTAQPRRRIRHRSDGAASAAGPGFDWAVRLSLIHI
ncbi:hypothetical protein [Streptomyces fragilis]|nr:hypothetical protein [Streptomyces fragilis]